MAKVTRIYEARVPVTHYQGNSRAEWVIGVQKVGRTYSVYGEEYAFCHIDNKIIDIIFESYVDDLRNMFYSFGEVGLITKKGQYTNAGSANTYLSGFKNEDEALQLAKWLESIAFFSLKIIPPEALDRSSILYKDIEVKAYDIIRESNNTNAVVKLFSDKMASSKIQ